MAYGGSQARGRIGAVATGLRHRHSSDLAWLWLWHRPAATAPIRPLAWERSYISGAVQEMAKRQKKKKKEEEEEETSYCEKASFTVASM